MKEKGQGPSGPIDKERKAFWDHVRSGGPSQPSAEVISFEPFFRTRPRPDRPSPSRPATVTPIDDVYLRKGKELK